jgi:hypothetical protein
MTKTLNALTNWNQQIKEYLEVPTYRGKTDVAAVSLQVVFYVCITVVILFAISKI